MLFDKTYFLSFHLFKLLGKKLDHGLTVIMAQLNFLPFADIAKRTMVNI